LGQNITCSDMMLGVEKLSRICTCSYCIFIK